jgi:hypothetical protein
MDRSKSEWSGDHEGDRVLVRHERDLVGIVSPSDVARWVRRVEELDLRRTERASGIPIGPPA